MPVRPRQARRSARDRLRFLAPLLTSVAVAAVVLVVLGNAGGSPSHKPASRASSTTTAIPNPARPNPTTPTIPAGGTVPQPPATTITGRPINWLGTQIATVQGTGAVVQTVQLGTPADTAGLDLGDVIQTINGHVITAANQIPAAVQGLRRGDAVKIAVDRGSTLFTAVMAFDGPPTTSP